jgi:hypothetical protein
MAMNVKMVMLELCAERIQPSWTTVESGTIYIPTTCPTLMSTMSSTEPPCLERD